MDVGYVWASDKYEKAKQKHELSFSDVVSVMEDPKGIEVPDEGSDSGDQWLWVGQTIQGRILVVVYDDIEDAPLSRIITAFDAEGDLLHEYQQG